MSIRREDCVIYPNVLLGQGVLLEAWCILGKPPRGKAPGELETVLGDGAIIRPFSTIYAGTKTGQNFQTGQGVSVREDNIIGDNVSVGTNSAIEIGNRIGDNVRIHSNCFLEMVTIEDDVIIAPNVVFTDDPHPPCPRYEECLGGATVKEGAKIGANSTILPGVVIGRRALVGAGAVVVEDVPDRAVVIGNPARVIKDIDDLECLKGFFDRPYSWERGVR